MGGGFRVASRMRPLPDLKMFIFDPLRLVTELGTSGDFVRFWMGPRRCVFVNEPELIRQVVVAERASLRRGLSTRLLRTVLGNGLLVSEDESWARERRPVHLALRNSSESVEHATRFAIERMLESWRKRPMRSLHDDLRRLTTDIAARVVLGVTPRDDDHIEPALELVADGKAFASLMAVPLLRALPTAGNRAARSARRLLDALVYSAMRDARIGDATVVGALHGVTPDLTDREIRDELVTLLFTAYDTTAAAIYWAIYLLARHPDVADQLRAERHRSRLVERIILETLRLYPPVPIQVRDVAVECAIGGEAVSPGTTIMWSQWAIHRDPRWHASPDIFDPERWTRQPPSALQPFTFFPFGGGRRTCVGEDLAIAVIAQVVTTLTARARFAFPAHAIMPEAIVTLQPRRSSSIAVDVLA